MLWRISNPDLDPHRKVALVENRWTPDKPSRMPNPLGTRGRGGAHYAVGGLGLGAVRIDAPRDRALRVFAEQSGDFWAIGLRRVYGHPLFPQRQPLDRFDGMGRTAPAQEFDFLVFERVLGPLVRHLGTEQSNDG